ncbi:MAG: OstA-like protein [Flavobacteriia bacterium]
MRLIINFGLIIAKFASVNRILKQIKNISKLASFLGAFFLCSITSWAQKDLLELLPGAEKLEYNEKTGAQRLIGNVNFKYQGNTMYCDSAYFYAKTKEVKAYGKVHINKQDTLNLFCDSLYYNGKTKYAKLWGHVRVRDREYKITTDSLDYDAKKGQGIYRHFGKIENIVNKEVLTSKVGYFYPDTKNFFFSGNVKYKSPEVTMTTDTLRYQYLQKKVYFYGPTKVKTKDADLFCDRGWYQTETEEGVLQKNAKILTNSKTIIGDSLYHNPKKGLSIGKGNVFYKDTIDPYELKGNYFYQSEKEHKSYITGKALLTYKLKEDTLFLHADTLFGFQDSLKQMNRILGYHNAKFFKNNIQGKCDSLIYNKADSTIELFHEPIIWAQNAELKGTKMTAFVKDSTVDRIEIFEKSTAILEIDSGKYYNQIAGKNMIAHFRENELVKVDVKTNAQTVYYPEETKENDTLVEIKRSGMNRIYAGDLRIDLDSGEVCRVVYLDKPDAIFYPLDQINKEEQFVRNFSWNPLLRPKSVGEMVE